jgi:hypothetical protein
VDANGIDPDPSVQDAHHVDLSHHGFDEVHLRGLKSHHVPEDLHGVVAS